MLFISRYGLGVLCTMAGVCHWWNPTQLHNIGTCQSFKYTNVALVYSVWKLGENYVVCVLNRMQIRFSTHLSELERNLGQNNKTEPNTCDGKYYVA